MKLNRHKQKAQLNPGHENSYKVRKNRTFIMKGTVWIASLMVMVFISVLPDAFATDPTDDSWYKAAEGAGNAFFDGASVTGGLYIFSRKRNRYNPETFVASKGACQCEPGGGKYETNLDHTTVLGNMDFSSGYIADRVGVDFAFFAAHDMNQDASVDHEFNFVPWENPYNPNWSNTETDSGASIYKADLKFKVAGAWAQAGYIQPSGPGGLGVNWNFMPGTYRGAQVGADFSGLSVAYMWADEYKAPWFQKTYPFYPEKGGKVINYVHSFGARYTFDNGLILDGAFSQSRGFLDTYHGKVKRTLAVADGKLFLAYNFYGAKDAGHYQVYDGRAWQQALQSSFTRGVYTVRAEATVVRANGKNGFFVYRTTWPNGSSQGVNDVWWDSRSDWNHNGEKAVFVGLWRELTDYHLPGWKVGASLAYGWDGKPASDYKNQDARLKESAFNLDISYTVPDGGWKGSSLSIHWTRYDNHSGLKRWEGFKNAFEDERDIKLSLMVPYTF